MNSYLPCLIIGNKKHLGAETGIQLRSFLVNSVFIRLVGHGPVALAVLAAE